MNAKIGFTTEIADLPYFTVNSEWLTTALNTPCDPGAIAAAMRDGDITIEKILQMSATEGMDTSGMDFTNKSPREAAFVLTANSRKDKDIVVKYDNRKNPNAMPIKKIMAEQEKTVAHLTAFVKELMNDIETEPIPEATPFGDTGAFVVSFRSILNSPSIVMTSEYYSQKVQAGFVGGALMTKASRGQAVEMINTMVEMVNTRRVTVGSTNHFLNEHTLAVIRRKLKEEDLV